MFGVSQKGARKWLEAEAIPDTKRIPQIADRLGVTAEWLLTGRGDPEQLPRRALNQSPAQQDISALLPTASPRSRSALERIARAADNGTLSEADVALLEQIAKHLAHEE